MKTLYRVGTILTLLSLLLVGCGPTAEPTPVAEPTSAALAPTTPPTAPPEPTSAPGPHGKLVVGSMPVSSMAPSEMVSIPAHGEAVFDGLVKPQEGGGLAPMLATSWKVLDDRVTWEFKLREGVTFHNGEPFNAEVVKWNVELVLNEKLRWYGRISTIKEVQVVDDYTVHVITHSPDALLPGRLMFYMMPPKGVEEAGGLDEYNKKPAGTGPYMVEEFLPGERLVLKYWPDSWRNGVVGVPDKPLEVEFISMADSAARIASLRAGDIDVAADVPFDEIAALEADGFRTTSVVEAAPQVVVLDSSSEDSPFADLRVRQAVNYAVDKEALINDLYLGYAGDLPGQNLAEDGFGHNPDIQAYPYDPEKARQLLAEAGYPDGFDTTLELRPSGEPRAEAVAAYLADVGINAEIAMLEATVWVQKIYQGGRAPMFWTGVNYLPLFDADFSYNWFWSKNEPEGARYFKNERFDELFEAQRQEMDRDKRLAMLHEMAQILHDEAPVLWLFRQGRAYAFNPRVKGLVLHADQHFYIDDVSLEE